MKHNKKILITYNAPVSIYPIYTGKPDAAEVKSQDLSEKGFAAEIDNIETSLGKYYESVSTLPITNNIESAIHKIDSIKPDVILNLVESIEGIASYEYCVAGVYELLGYEYTGNTPQTLGNCLNKSTTKNILRAFNIHTPDSITISDIDEINKNEFQLKFPVIVKLLKEDASIGISEYSVVTNFNDLKKQTEFLFSTYKNDLIIEEYINGRELNVAVLGKTVLPISEISFKGLPEHLPNIVTYESKWIADSLYYKKTIPVCPAKLNDKLKSLIERTTIQAFNALSCRDYARVDIRLNKENIPYVIEINPNPDISIDSGFNRAANIYGLTHEELLFKISEFALKRSINDTQDQAVR